MKQTLLILYLFVIFSGCGTIFSFNKPDPELSPKLTPTKKSILEKLSFLPFIKSKTPTVSSQAKIELLQKLGANVSAFLTLIELTNLKGRNKVKVKTDSLLSFDE